MLLTIGWFYHMEIISAVKANDLLGDTLYTEGIHALPDGLLLMGGFGDGVTTIGRSVNQLNYAIALECAE
jgi:hypothetical protein